jgi:azurin
LFNRKEQSIMKIQILVTVAAVVVSGFSGPQVIAKERTAAFEAPVRTVVLTAGDPVGDKMTFSRRTITAKPGERLRVQLISTGVLPKIAMSHNFVLLKLGSDPKRFADTAATARATDFIPPTLEGQVIASTSLVGSGEKTEVTFTVPDLPGRYPYLCSFPGHYAAGMSGDLIVK